MTHEEILKNYILKRYHSLREFAKVADIPYTTLVTILKRGINNSSVGNIIRICKTLNISADALANGIIEYKFNDNQTSTTTDIRDIVNTAKSNISEAITLTIDGKTIDIEQVEPIIDALDISYEMVKRKTTKEVNQ